MKTTAIAALLLLSTSAAWAHRPQIIDCQTYAEIAREAVVSRDAGESLETAQATLRHARPGQSFIDTYQALQRDVWTSQEYRGASPSGMQQAALKGCSDFNAEQRRTRELY